MNEANKFQYVYPITPLVMPLTYKAMTLYLDIKAMALYPNKSFENNISKICLIQQAKMNSLNLE